MLSFWPSLLQLWGLLESSGTRLCIFTFGCRSEPVLGGHQAGTLVYTLALLLVSKKPRALDVPELSINALGLNQLWPRGLFVAWAEGNIWEGNSSCGRDSKSCTFAPWLFAPSCCWWKIDLWRIFSGCINGFISSSIAFTLAPPSSSVSYNISGHRISCRTFIVEVEILRRAHNFFGWLWGLVFEHQKLSFFSLCVCVYVCVCVVCVCVCLDQLRNT